MATPAYLWIKDDIGKNIVGSVNVTGREGSIEILGFSHDITLPIDVSNGKITAPRIHSPFCFDKNIDSSTPYLYKALCCGQKLKSAEIKFYNINYAGQEVEYFSILMEKVNVVSMIPIMYDIKTSYGEKHNHLEYVELRYEKITWHYMDGNIIHSDSWNERKTA